MTSLPRQPCNLADIPVVILCGGMGTRLREASEKLLKPLANGHQLSLLHEAEPARLMPATPVLVAMGGVVGRRPPVESVEGLARGGDRICAAVVITGSGRSFGGLE